jgi:hypothetical protein
VNPRPRRGGTWTCPQCRAQNEEGRNRCVNLCGTSGPLAPRPKPAEPQPAEPEGGA